MAVREEVYPPRRRCLRRRAGFAFPNDAIIIPLAPDKLPTTMFHFVRLRRQVVGGEGKGEGERRQPTWPVSLSSVKLPVSFSSALSAGLAPGGSND